MLDFVFDKHLRLAFESLILFAVGLFVAWPVIRYRLRAVAWLPLALMRAVLRLMGPSPSLPRMAGLIFGFNSLVIFLYMASGLHRLPPMVFGIWTGMNVGIIIGMATRGPGMIDLLRPAPGQWVPSPGLAVLCGPAVLLLELPCFWFSVAMGISMGQQVQAGTVAYGAALALRARAFAEVIMPLLLLSAVAEAVAIRGSAAHTPPEPPTAK